jgi:hypothetical protein
MPLPILRGLVLFIICGAVAMPARGILARQKIDHRPENFRVANRVS